MAKIRVRVPLRRSKYKVRQSFSYSRKSRKKLKKTSRIKVYPKVYRFKAKRDRYGQWRGLKA